MENPLLARWVRRPHISMGTKRLIMLSALLVTARSVYADEPITIPVVGPMTISYPGIYVLAEDLKWSNSSESIQITGSDITLDLRGHGIQGATSGTALVIQSSARNITIRNGGISGSYPFKSTGTNVTVENMGFGGCDWCAEIGGSGRVRVEDSYFGGYVAGLIVSGEHIQEAIIRNNRASALIYPMSVGMIEGVVENNVISALQRGGLGVGASGRVVVRGNTVSGGSSYDNSAGISIFADNSLISNNSSTVVKGPGMMLFGAGNHVTGNTLSGNGLRGLMVFFDGNVIEDNVVTGNGWDGIQIRSAANVIDGNEVSNNSGCGLDFTTGPALNIVGHNQFLNNEGGDICGDP